MGNTLKKYNLIFFGLLCGLIACIFDATIDAIFFSNESFVEQLLEPSAFEIYFRSTLVGLFLLFGIYAQQSNGELQLANRKLSKLSTAIEHADEAICISDQDGNIDYINPAFSKLTGFSLNEAIGAPASLLKCKGHEDQYYQNVIDNVNSSNQAWHERIINQRKDGSSYPAFMTISPVFGDDGEVTSYIGIQQNMEKQEQLEQQFFQAQKMEAIGTLVGGIAHDFNNTLAAITGNLFLVKEDANGMPAVTAQLEHIESLAFSSAEMIQQLLAFSRKGIVNIQPVKITSQLKDLVRLYTASLPSHVDFHVEISDEDMTIDGDINLLHQVILNLLNNARDAVEDVKDASISLNLEKLTVDHFFQTRHPAASANNYASISVTDNGCGIDPAHRDKIFEPFFTTKEVGKGSGLGLSMAYGSIQSHGGFIDVTEGNHSHGTTMTIYLPIKAQEQSGDRDKKTAAKIIKGHGETILLVEDNAVVLAAGQDILTRLNYQPLAASDSGKAVQLYQARMNEIDLVILDAGITKAAGGKTVEQIRSINPDVKILFVTGHNKDQSGMMASETVLSKPYEISNLSQHIHQIIAG